MSTGTSFRRRVERLFRRAGTAATLRVYTGVTGTAGSGSITPAYSDAAIRVVAGEFSEAERLGAGVTTDDRKYWISGASLAEAGVVDVSQRDRLVIGADSYAIGSRKRWEISGVLVYVEVVARA